MTVIKPYLKLIRPKQWAKNVFIFIPLVFDGQLRLKSSFLKTLAGFALLCALYAATYIFNDLNDLEADRAPRKRKTGRSRTATFRPPTPLSSRSR